DEDRVLLEVARGDLGELLGDAHVVLVRGDGEEGVGERRRLLGDRLRDLRMGVADRRDADAASEVDELVAVDVDEDRARSPLHVDVGEGARAAGDARDATLLQLARPRARDLGDELALLGDAESHSPSVGGVLRTGGETCPHPAPSLGRSGWGVAPHPRGVPVSRALPLLTVTALAVALVGCTADAPEPAP